MDEIFTALWAELCDAADETAQQISCFVLIAIEVVEVAASRVWEFREIEEVPIKRARQMRGTWQ